MDTSVQGFPSLHEIEELRAQLEQAKRANRQLRAKLADAVEKTEELEKRLSVADPTPVKWLERQLMAWNQALIDYQQELTQTRGEMSKNLVRADIRAAKRNIELYTKLIDLQEITAEQTPELNEQLNAYLNLGEAIAS